MPEPKMPTPEEMAKIEEERDISDKELLKDGAELSEKHDRRMIKEIEFQMENFLGSEFTQYFKLKLDLSYNPEARKFIVARLQKDGDIIFSDKGEQHSDLKKILENSKKEEVKVIGGGFIKEENGIFILRGKSESYGEVQEWFKKLYKEHLKGVVEFV